MSLPFAFSRLPMLPLPLATWPGGLLCALLCLVQAWFMPWQAWLMLKSTAGKIKKSKRMYSRVLDSSHQMELEIPMQAFWRCSFHLYFDNTGLYRKQWCVLVTSSNEEYFGFVNKIKSRQLFDPLLFQASDCYRGQQWAAPGGNGSFSGISSGTVNIWWRLFFPDSSISIIITGTFCVVHCCSVFRLNCADPIVNTVPVPVESRGFPSILKRYISDVHQKKSQVKSTMVFSSLNE